MNERTNKAFFKKFVVKNVPLLVSVRTLVTLRCSPTPHHHHHRLSRGGFRCRRWKLGGLWLECSLTRISRAQDSGVAPWGCHQDRRGGQTLNSEPTSYQQGSSCLPCIVKGLGAMRSEAWAQTLVSPRTTRCPVAKPWKVGRTAVATTQGTVRMTEGLEGENPDRHSWH